MKEQNLKTNAESVEKGEVGDERSLNETNETPGTENNEGDDVENIVTDDEPTYEQQIEQLNMKIAELEAALDEQRQRHLRVQADFENFRKRTRKEKEDLLKYASQPVITALLPALDNLERAIVASQGSSTDDGLAKGVEMVYRQILDILGTVGLKEIPAVGEPFNPEFHEAVMHEESDDYESGIISEQFQKGYLLKDRVIRPSMVKVTK